MLRNTPLPEIGQISAPAMADNEFLVANESHRFSECPLGSSNMGLSLAAKPCRLGEVDLRLGLLELFLSMLELSRRHTNPTHEVDPFGSTRSHLRLSECTDLSVEFTNLEML